MMQYSNTLKSDIISLAKLNSSKRNFSMLSVDTLLTETGYLARAEKLAAEKFS